VIATGASIADRDDRAIATGVTATILELRSMGAGRMLGTAL
jgi:hypothetical protein